MKEFINSYGMAIISTILTAVVGFIGAKLKKYLDEKENADFAQKTVERVVKAVEQMYRSTEGIKKYQIAFDNISEILTNKGIYITGLEIEMMIESCVAEFNKPWKKAESETIREEN